jgi:hypothetical protein
MNQALKQKLSELISWSANPEPPQKLAVILASFSNEELVLAAVALSDGSPPGRMVWAEYARRRKYLDFVFDTSELGKGKLVIEAEAKPVHDAPIFDSKKPA